MISPVVTPLHYFAGLAMQQFINSYLQRRDFTFTDQDRERIAIEAYNLAAKMVEIDPS